MRLLFLIVLVYLVYRIAKSWLMRNLQAPAGDGSGTPRIDDVMIKDPVCGIYFPQREGLELRHDGQRHMFCSAACRDRFLELQKRKE